MRARRITAIALVSIVSGVAAASCALAPESASETESTRDEGPLDVDTTEDAERLPPPKSKAPQLDIATQAGDGFSYRVCVLLKGGPTVARAAFCLSQPESDTRWRCYSHLADSPVSWANWCYNEFAE